MSGAFLAEYPKLSRIISIIDEQLRTVHPTVFGPKAHHPVLPVKRAKVIHDSLWGTTLYSWRELVLIDSPIMQRMRDIHQTGLAHQVYPSATHSRFEHSLGAATIASRVFDSLAQKQLGDFKDIAKAVAPRVTADNWILKIRQELRLAALLHDTGHSLFSHTSEIVYSKLPLLVEASGELTSFSGKEKGAGEVISFCLVLTPALQELLARAAKHLTDEQVANDYSGDISFVNIALIIIGRAEHPFLQFLGDIVSSGFDADKLDYLLRDAKAAGLPLTYDIDRYLYDVRVTREALSDGNGALNRLYTKVGATIERRPPAGGIEYPHYQTYRLRLSHRAMNVIEQIIICKMMLFSYIYHHGKVRAAEGMLARLLERCVALWRQAGESDEVVFRRFMSMSDASLRGELTALPDDTVQTYSYRIVNRLLAREVYGIKGPAATHAEAVIVGDFLADLQDRERRETVTRELETAIADQLIKLDSSLGSDRDLALARTGVWVDAPKPPKIEDIDSIVKDAKADAGASVAQIFPIREWTQAYAHYRYVVRIFAFSEYCALVTAAAKTAMTDIIGISSAEFYNSIARARR